jgi:DNA polymerase-3 subunit epsilon
MNLLARWFGKKPQLSLGQQQRLAAWSALPQADIKTPVIESRYVVVDVETTGLNLMSDCLISIGAVAVVNGRIDFGDGFYVVLQQATVSSKENILLHGIGGSDQTDGVPAVEALLEFLGFLKKDPLVAFHVTFDQTMIQRAMREFLGLNFKHPWLDLAYLMPGLNPPLASRYRSLDDWIGHFNIHNEARHNALADALVTAQLLLRAVGQAKTKKANNYNALCDLESAQRWVSTIS